MSYTNILTQQNNGVLEITINRPKQLNAINKLTIEEIGDAMQQAEANPEIGVIIITGSGEKAFVAGADIKEFAHFDIEKGKY
jgi:enoyl-CoA hydratase